MSADITASSGNVFADLGLSNPEARLAKADARIVEDQLDAIALRAFCRRTGGTPSMMEADRDIWKARAEEAEAEVKRLRRHLNEIIAGD